MPFHYKFEHLDFKYKRLYDVSPSNSKNTTNRTGAGDKINLLDDFQLLRDLARQETMELHNRQNSASGLAAATASSSDTKAECGNSKSAKQQGKTTADQSPQQRRPKEEHDVASKEPEMIMSKEITDAIGYFPQAQFLLLPNTTGRFKHDERKLAAKHSAVRRAKAQIFFGQGADAEIKTRMSNSGDDKNNDDDNANETRHDQERHEATDGESNRIMLFGQDTSALALKCAKAMTKINTDLMAGSHKQQQQQQQSKPLLIVVEKQLEKLLQMSQLITKLTKLTKNSDNNNNNNDSKSNSSVSEGQPSSIGGAPSKSSFFIRASDPYFSLLHCVPDRSLRRIVVSFPPPCSSDSESHRRIVNHHFLSLAHQKLTLGGDIVVATDYRPLHRFHEEQVMITEGKVSWAAPPPRTSSSSSSSLSPSADTNSTDFFDDNDKKRKTKTQLRAAIQEEKHRQEHQQHYDPSVTGGDHDDASSPSPSELLDIASLPTIDEAPARIKFSLLQKQQQGQSPSGLFYVLRRFKDLETPDHVVLQNVNHVNERRLRYGALTKE